MRVLLLRTYVNFNNKRLRWIIHWLESFFKIILSSEINILKFFDRRLRINQTHSSPKYSSGIKISVSQIQNAFRSEISWKFEYSQINSNSNDRYTNRMDSITRGLLLSVFGQLARACAKIQAVLQNFGEYSAPSQACEYPIRIQSRPRVRGRNGVRRWLFRHAISEARRRPKIKRN